MIANFLRPARGPAEFAADALRGLGMLSVLIAAIWYAPTDAGILAFALPGLFGARFIGLRPAADISCCSILLIAAWSNVFDLYTRISWWDILIHVLCTGVLAAVLHSWAECRGVVASAEVAPTVLTISITAAIGLALSALWEMVEWIGFVFITQDIYVTYHDTISDMAAGGFGAACAGIIVAKTALIRADAVLPDLQKPAGSSAEDPSLHA